MATADLKFRSAYDGKRHRVSLSFLDEDGNQAIGRTKQAHKDECDINRILHTYDKTGLITHVSASVAQYGDFTEVNEYQESLNTVIAAQNAFDELPASIRKKFGNDPGAFFEFATDPDNADAMVTLGLANAPDVPLAPEPVEVRVVNEAASTAV